MATPSKAKSRTGAHTSTRQLARTVKDGRLVTFRTDVEDVVGYLGGMDDYHWMVVTPTCEILLVHKSAAQVISLNPVAGYSQEPQFEALERIISPFRKYVMETYFGQVSATALTEEYARS